MYRSIAILITMAATGVVAFGDTAPIPQSLLGVDYINVTGIPALGSSLVCTSDWCGGVLGATINSGATQQAGGVEAAIWCVDYQLEVSQGNQYTTDITALNDITTPTDANVRYGNLSSVSPSGTPVGWSNSVTDPTGLDAGDVNNAAYRYTLAAALVSEYNGSPTTADPQELTNSPVNAAIQEAIWYITYNSDYQTGATWPPTGSGISASGNCGAGSVADSSAPTGAAADDYSCWVQYAEDNANTVNTSAWAVVSGPADAAGDLLSPENVDGNPSYQTFLVQVASSTITTGSSGGPLPEPTYFALLGVSCMVLFVVSRRRRKA